MEYHSPKPTHIHTYTHIIIIHAHTYKPAHIHQLYIYKLTEKLVFRREKMCVPDIDIILTMVNQKL